MKNNELIQEIKHLKKEKNALILAHNYQIVEIQDLADYRGDSLQLSILAKEVKAPLIVFCGVKFMAETAAILNPESTILLPAIDAGCPMADMISLSQLKAFKQNYPGSPVVCYVNSSVEVKAESDVCCTSSNAVKILKSFSDEKPILFVPDRNLGSWAGKQSGKKVITWDGYCLVHQYGFSEEDVLTLKNEYPDYKLLVHPECSPQIIKYADLVISTGGMVDWVKNNDKAIIATEIGLTEYLQHIYPEKSLIPLSPKAICKNMKKTTLENVYNALKYNQYVISVEPNTAQKARKAIDRMLELSR
ncbi:quinolinate synthase NadA [Candidatus Cloacimonas acidaminovorans]|jgi:quinolinate synthase|uniref:Quinolinate synthase n=1 Tax=Cloacimonas acidaminovorans (strain Evry) TaxID=459349 RepID=B0VEZ8_CLOAI|nr:quinolinate synthase NadA [Candidatus Cloacimonas acidaminovorans]CAO80233.1 quinolinate synthetase [Candidatus Cloacimonas acidaminovorans str. Evry]HNV61570.1 quinolinate synthase NadA [Candidatus Cloacimonas acidaminovorans]HPU99818.1 quinolinate synthase NadA [Candidatus Cloacimonas acidaminovorans]